LLAELRGPDDRYRLAIEVLASEEGRTFTRHRATSGLPLWDLVGQGGEPRQKQAVGGAPHSYRVVVDDVVSLVLVLGENGFTLRGLKLLNAGQATISALVTTGPASPDWLPHESTYLLYQGDRSGAAFQPSRFIPLEGMVQERSWFSDEQVPLDRLAGAVWRSIARANEALVRCPGTIGTPLVTSVTIRFAIEQTDLTRGRVVVSLAKPGTASGNQFVQFTLQTLTGATAALGLDGLAGLDGVLVDTIDGNLVDNIDGGIDDGVR
jgi:hypothetical protein